MNEKFKDHPSLKEIEEAREKSNKLKWRLNHEVYKDYLTLREKILQSSEGALEVTLKLQQRPSREGYVVVKAREFVVDDPSLLHFIAEKTPHFSVRAKRDYFYIHFSNLDIYTSGELNKLSMWEKRNFKNVYQSLTSGFDPLQTYRVKLHENEDGSRVLSLYDTNHYDDWDFLNNLLSLSEKLIVRFTGELLHDKPEIELQLHVPKDK